MNKIAFFSVCVPVYNAEKYLDESLMSVLVQCGDYTEILLVNDGSSDKSAEICDNYAKRYPNIVRVMHQNNQGPLVARNNAVKMATGNYLLFLDADDMFVPDAFEKIKGEIEKTNADAVFFDIARLTDNKIAPAFTSPYKSHSIFVGDKMKQVRTEIAITEDLNSLCRKCIKRELYDIDDEVFRNGNIKQGEDKLVSLFCFDKAESVAYLKENLYIYRDNNNSTTHNLTLQNYKNLQIVFSYTEQFMEKWGVDEDARIKQKLSILAAAINSLTSLYLRYRTNIGTREDIVEAIDYITGDERFLTAYYKGRHLLPLAHKISLFLLVKRNYAFLISWLKVLEIVRRLRNN